MAGVNSGCGSARGELQARAAARCRTLRPSPGSPSSPSRSDSRAPPPRSAAPCRRRTITARPASSARSSASCTTLRELAAGEMIRHQVRGAREPEIGDAVQHPPLVGNRIGQHHVERRQPVGGDDEHACRHRARRCRAPCPRGCAQDRAARCGRRWALAWAWYYSGPWARHATHSMAMKWIGKVVGGLLGGLVLGPARRRARRAPRSPVRRARARRRRRHAANSSRRSASASSAPPSASWAISPRPTGACRSWRSPPRAASWTELRLTPAQVREAIACFTAGKQPRLRSRRASSRRCAAACRGRPDLLRVFLEIQVRAALAGNNLDGPVRPLLQHVAARARHRSARARAHRGGAAHPARRFRAGRPDGHARRVRRRRAIASSQEAYRVLETQPRRER